MPLVVTSPAVGIALLLGALVILGTWPAMMDICTLYKRNDIHIFLDYATGDFAFAVIAALTLGSLGAASPDNPTFFTQLGDMGRNWPSVISTLAGGALLMFGNLTLQIALTMGTSLGVILPIQGALCVIISTTINYSLSPENNDATLLFSGMFFFLLAIVLSSLAEVKYKGYLRRMSREHPKGIAVRRAERKAQHDSAGPASDGEDEEVESASETDSVSSGNEDATEASLADITGDTDAELVEQAVEKRASVQSNKVMKGLLVASSGGVAFGFFSPLFNIGVNDHFHWLPEGTVHLTGWTANFFFALSFWFWAHVTGVARMSGGPKPTDFGAYVKDGNKRGLAFATGVVCGLGNTLQFLGGMAAGFATCDVVQAFPLVGILWGMLLFGEFRKGPVGVKVLLVCVYIVYIVAVSLLALSVEEEDMPAAEAEGIPLTGE